MAIFSFDYVDFFSEKLIKIKLFEKSSKNELIKHKFKQISRICLQGKEFSENSQFNPFLKSPFYERIKILMS